MGSAKGAVLAGRVGAAHSAVETVAVETAEVVGVDIEVPKPGLGIDLCCMLRGDFGFMATVNVEQMWW